MALHGSVEAEAVDAEAEDAALVVVSGLEVGRCLLWLLPVGMRIDCHQSVIRSESDTYDSLRIDALVTGLSADL